jgi:hypothetical protein
MATIETIEKVEDVRNFAAKINEELDHCGNGGPTPRDSLDGVLENYATRCVRLNEQIRAWARDVFCGRIAFDESMEEAWVKAGVSLRNRSHEMLRQARQNLQNCRDPSNLNKLDDAVGLIAGLLDGWVSPHLSVSPAARMPKLPDDQVEAARKKISSLPPLPADWNPADPRLKINDRTIRNT